MVSIEKMDKSKNFAWAFKIKSWLSGLDYKSHLFTTVKSIPTENREQWIKIDV